MTSKGCKNFIIFILVAMAVFGLLISYGYIALSALSISVLTVVLCLPLIMGIIESKLCFLILADKGGRKYKVRYSIIDEKLRSRTFETLAQSLDDGTYHYLDDLDFSKKKFNIKIDFDVLDIEEKDENNVDNDKEVK